MTEQALHAMAIAFVPAAIGGTLVVMAIVIAIISAESRHRKQREKMKSRQMKEFIRDRVQRENKKQNTLNKGL